jgi:hypothetical protein
MQLEYSLLIARPIATYLHGPGPFLESCQSHVRTDRRDASARALCCRLHKPATSSGGWSPRRLGFELQRHHNAGTVDEQGKNWQEDGATASVRLKSNPVRRGSMSVQASLPWLVPHVRVRYWHATIILPKVLYGCETWSPTLTEEHRLRVFVKRVFRPRRDEVTGGWRKLHNDELRELYSSPSIIRIIKLRRMR